MRFFSSRKLLWLILGITLGCLKASALILYVAPNGNDAWSGRLPEPNLKRTDGPLASLHGARDALRVLQPLTEPASVVVADGLYFMSEPLLLTPADSGSATCPIHYRAAAGAHPIFSGGRPITNWVQEGPLWSTTIPMSTTGPWKFEQLWVNHRRAVRARHPNRGFHAISSAHEEQINSPRSPNEPRRTRQFIGLDPSDWQFIGQAPPPALADMQIIAHQNWEVTRRRLHGLNLKTGVLTLLAPPMHPTSHLRPGSAYYLENSRSFLDEPGEWFLSRSGKLFYLPRAGENIRAATTVAPVLEAFVRLQGDASAGQYVQYLSFSGLTFKFSQWLTPNDGVDPFQAARDIDAVIMADGVKHLTIANCTFAHLGKYALWLRSGCTDVTISQCHLYDLGAGGIRIGETRIPTDPADNTANIIVDNNIIHSGGRIFPDAVGIWIGQSGHNTISHNDVSDFFYSGISVGWTWGYGRSLARDNLIDSNLIHHLGWGMLSDLGGIYTLGVSPGTKITRNVVHHVSAGEYGGWGIYLDEGSSDILAEKNLVYDTMSGGFHLHYGRTNIVQNNIFSLGRDAQLQLTKAEPHLSLTFIRNIVYWVEGDLFKNDWKSPEVDLDQNLYFSLSINPIHFNDLSLSTWQALGRDSHSLIADPKFVNPTRRDFKLQTSSPALTLGFKPFDTTRVGVYGTPQWIKTAIYVARPVSPSWSTETLSK